MIKKNGCVYRLDTENTSLVLRTDSAEYLYYGKKLESAGDFSALGGGRFRFVTCPGKDGDYSEPAVCAVNADGGFVCDFQFSKARILPEKPEISGLPSSYGTGKTLELKYIDKTKLTLYLYYTVFEDGDAIAVSCKLVNGGKKDVSIRRLMSLRMELIGTDGEISTFNGCWARERSKYTRSIGTGTFVNESKKGASSHESNPFVMLQNGRGAYAFNLVYSGNHKEIFACDPRRGTTSVLVGMSDYMFDWKLAPGEEFCAPEAVMCFAPDEDSMSLRMHAFVREHIVRGKWKKRERPVLVNNWEGTYFHFNEQKLLDMARAAAGLGAELFVLDDGWFGRRDDDTSSLGDWFDYTEKLGGSLTSIADKIRALGLSFGIWVEPEMISENSELYRTHPNFAMKIPGREPFRQRNQLMLNLADERVQNYVVRTIGDVIARSGASYVKWDFNRALSDCYGKGIAPGEYFHRYMLGYYSVVSRLMKKFPFVLFEGCAGGGGRFDLGNLCYFPQFWTSDDTDARERIEIQAGTSFGYPQTVMGAHVSASPNHQTGNASPLSARFNVACGGLLGYELDVTKFTEEERTAVAGQIAFYKENRKLLQFGDHYRLEAENVCGFITVGKDKNEAIAVVNILAPRPAMPVPAVRFKGLNAAVLYEVRLRGTDVRFVLGGDVLMNGDIPLESVLRYMPRESGSIVSGMFVFRKVRN